MNINTNVTSIAARRQLNNTQNALKQNIQRLSTGLRINNASDDAAGLAISEGMKAGIRSLSQAQQNGSDAVSMLETAEGGMSQTQDILGRMKELSTQANSAAINDEQRKAIDAEFQELKSELDDVAEDTEFNDKKLLDGNFQETAQLGRDAGDTVDLSVGQNFEASAGFGLSQDMSLSTQANAADAVSTIDDAISNVSSERASVGAQINRVETKIDNKEQTQQSLEAANSRIRDTDIAKETAALTQNQILSQAGTSTLTQANSIPQRALSFLQG